MRRFRLRRRRAVALALLPFTALMTTQTEAIADEAPRQAKIDASKATVSFGDAVTLRGGFPGASKAQVEIRYRGNGTAKWQTAARTRTGPGGSYRVSVKPRRSGVWRAELAAYTADTPAGTPAAAAVDRASGGERIGVRSRTQASVVGRHKTIGDSLKVRGTVAPAGAKRRVIVRIGSEKEAVTAGANGRFSVETEARATGEYPVRVKARGNALASGSADGAGKVTVYRPAAASWYGPGLYGNGMACGGTLTPATIGVAHKTLPCGTKLTLRYGDRSVDVRVIDRGPFAGNREFDLTSATKSALGFPDVGTVLTSR